MLINNWRLSLFFLVSFEEKNKSRRVLCPTVLDSRPVQTFEQLEIDLLLSYLFSRCRTIVFFFPCHLWSCSPRRLVESNVLQEIVQQKWNVMFWKLTCWCCPSALVESPHTKVPILNSRDARLLRTKDGGAQGGRATPDHPFYTPQLLHHALLLLPLWKSFSRSPPPFFFFFFLFSPTCCVDESPERWDILLDSFYLFF